MPSIPAQGTPAKEQGFPWKAVPSVPPVEENRVHVWRADLNLPTTARDTLWEYLSEDERIRAGRFHFPEHRKHFIAGRGLLRVLLARYLGVLPSSVRFRYNPYGKPELADEYSRARLGFNISHSSGIALLAFASGRQVGVDVERIREAFASEEVAARFFSSQEVAVLQSLPSHLKVSAFFNCWTRKEAFIKAKGMGLSLPLDQFDVSVAPGEPAAILETRGDPLEAGRWSLQGLAPKAGYAAAIAVEGHDWNLDRWSADRLVAG